MSRYPTDDAWDICDDFFEPLAAMLWEWQNTFSRWCESPPPEYDLDGNVVAKLDEYETNYAYDPPDCEEALFNLVWPWTVRLVGVWLEVNVSCELADRVTKRIAEVALTVKDHSRAGWWPDTGEACWYFWDLVRVLRQRQGKSISKTELEAEAAKEKAQADDFRGPYTLADLVNGKQRKDGTCRKGLLGVTKSAFYERVKKAPDKYRKGSGNEWFLHRSLLPRKESGPKSS